MKKALYAALALIILALSVLPVAAVSRDAELIARVIVCEAGDSYAEKYALAETILRRVADPRYPNSVAGIVYEEGVFPRFLSGKSPSGKGRARPVDEYTLALRAACDAIAAHSVTSG